VITVHGSIKVDASCDQATDVEGLMTGAPDVKFLFDAFLRHLERENNRADGIDDATDEPGSDFEICSHEVGVRSVVELD